MSSPFDSLFNFFNYSVQYELHREKTCLQSFQPGNTNRAVQPQKIVRGFKFWIYEVEGLFYLCSEKKGADQLCDYGKADLRLCFSIGENQVFMTRLISYRLCSISLLYCIGIIIKSGFVHWN